MLKISKQKKKERKLYPEGGECCDKEPSGTATQILPLIYQDKCEQSGANVSGASKEMAWHD